MSCAPALRAPGCGLGRSAARRPPRWLRERLGELADATLCQACHASTGGNPFLLESLASALR